MDDLLDTAPCGFLSFSDDGTIVLVNRTLATFLGTTAGELTGKHIETILAVGGRVFYHTHFFPLLKMQKVAEEIYFSLRTPGGEEVPVLCNAVRHERDGRQFNDCVFVRMRQRRRYEDELLRARKQADLANESKSKFLSMMSHDLRTPLQAISGYASLLLMDDSGTLTDEQREHVLEIRSAGGEMLRLMNDILSFAQLESGRVELHPQRVLANDVIKRAEKLVHVQFEQRSITYERRDCSENIAMLADPDRVLQVMLNLLTNAAKFTPEGGKVWVTCESAESQIRIHVCDTGVGIPRESLASVFDPFVQVETATDTARRKGVGLGLSISRDLIRAMGGDIGVSSEVGKGSQFTIGLPAAL